MAAVYPCVVCEGVDEMDAFVKDVQGGRDPMGDAPPQSLASVEKCPLHLCLYGAVAFSPASVL